jgi:hypothetical protein
MKDTPKYESREPEVDDRDLLALNGADDLTRSTGPLVHQLKKGIICATERRAQRRSPFQIVVDATEGFIPLWDENLVLRWKFKGFRCPSSVNPKPSRRGFGSC